MDQLDEIELTIEDAKSKIEDLDALNRLSGNKDFQRIIDTGYFVTKAADTVMTKAHPSMQTPEQQAGCIKTIDAIGELRQYFQAITQIGKMARTTLADYQATKEEVLDEDLADA